MENKIIADGPICSLDVAASEILAVTQRNGEIVVTLKDGTQKQIAASSGDASALSVQLSSGELYTAYEMGSMFAMETSEEIYAEGIQEAALEQSTPEEQTQQSEQPPALEQAAEGSQEQALMDQLAEELADVETAAGDDGGAAGGSGGYGFNSDFASQNVEGIDDIGALGETELQYGVGEFGEKSFLANAAPIKPTLTLLDPETGLPLEGSYEVLEDGSIQLLLQAVPDSDAGILTITIKGIPSTWTVTGEGTYNPATQTWTITVGGGQTFTGGPIVTPPADSDVDLTGLIFTVTELDPFTGQTGTATATIDVIVDAVADPAEITTQDTTAVEDTAADVIFNGAAGDKDGSEVVVKYVVSGVPDGFNLSAGTKLPDGTYELTPNEIQGLKLNPPANFYGDVQLTVTVHTAETVTDKDFDLTNNTATATDTLCITFTPAADPPTVTVNLPDPDGPGVADPAAKVYEDGTVKVEFAADLAETASPTEFLTVTITGVNLTLLAPNSFEISGLNGAMWTRVPGSPDTAASFTLTLPAGVDYKGTMQFTPKANSDLDLSDIKVSATSTEPASNTTADSNVEQFDVIVDAVADKPTLHAEQVKGVEDTTGAVVKLSTTLGDTDGSESVVKYVVSGVPNGFSLSVGTSLGGGVYELTPQQAAMFKVLSPDNFYGDINLSVKVINKEAVTDSDFDLTNNENFDTETLCVSFAPTADPPTVDVDLPKGPDCGCPGNPGLVAQVYEDNSVSVNFSAARAATASPTEFLTVTITGVNLTLLAPNSFTITGAHGATWTRVAGTSDANASFKITLPAGTDYQGSMKFVPKADSDIDLSDIKVSAVATEPASQTTANSNVEEFDVIVDAVADKPTIQVDDHTADDKGLAVAIKINAAVTDTDGSEHILHYEISGVPNGFTFNKGENLGNGVWKFTPAQIQGLTMSPPNANYEGKINLTVKVFNFDDPTDKDFDSTNNYNNNSTNFTVDWQDDKPIARDDTITGMQFSRFMHKAVGEYIQGDLFTGKVTAMYGPWATHLKNSTTGTADYMSKDGGNRVSQIEYNGNTYTIAEGGSVTIKTSANGKYYGDITFYSNGTYILKENGSKMTKGASAFSDKFLYTLVDKDGDASKAYLNIKNMVLRSPLALDLDGDGVNLIGNENGVLFDIDNDGIKDQIGWVASTDGILAFDINKDGIINNQSELFGDNDQFESGFAKLASHDLNGDNVIDAADEIFGQLLIWRDLNSDGISDAAELFSLSDFDIVSISLGAQEVFETLEGNVITHTSTFVFGDGRTHDIVDAWFDTTDAADTTVLTGEDGLTDIFTFEAGNAQSVLVRDFNSEDGDILDISALLGDDFDPLQDAINEFVFSTTTDQGSTILSIDADGAEGPSAAVQFAVLHGVTTSVDELVNNGSIAT